jgi:hypothetical protein
LKRELQQFFSGPEYRESVKKRILAGSAPTVEIYLLQMLYGKPREVIDLHVEVQEDLSLLSIEELAQRATDLLSQLEEARQLEEAIPAEYRSEPPREASPEEISEMRDALILAEAAKRAAQKDT